MNPISRTRLLLAGLALLGAGLAAAQQTNYAELERLSRQFQAEAFAQRLSAEAKARQAGLPIKGRDANGRLFQLVRFEGNQPVYFITDNLTAAKTISTDKVWPGGSTGLNLTGEGITLRIWDGGAVRTTHQEFGGRVTIKDGSAVDFHPTHVGGILAAAGVDPNAKGGSFKANLNSWDWNNDTGEMAAEATQGMQISNHSYGTVVGWLPQSDGWYWFGNATISGKEDHNFGRYTAEARSWDLVANNAPYYLPFKSAGNDRLQGPTTQPTGFYWNGTQWAANTVARDLDGGPDGYDSLGPVATAKNVMVVAAVEDIPTGWNGPESVVMSGFSCWGPTDDGRIKPDISTNGVGLYSTSSSGDTAYEVASGTSMASPSAAGSAGLLARQYEVKNGRRMRGATLRGLIIHTADEAGSANGPDYRFGWGLMNTARAAQTIADDGDNGMIVESVMSEATAFVYRSDGKKPLKVTLSWNDPAGAAGGDVLDDTTSRLVRDLDVRLIKGSTTYSPWVLDPANPASPATTGDNFRDNVEVVEIPAPQAGDYTIQITSKKGFGPQTFSMIVSGATVVTGLPEVKSLSLNPSVVKGASPSVATVTLMKEAPDEGAVIKLNSNNSFATLPATVTIPPHALSANFTINTKRVNATQIAKITGTSGSSSASADLTIRPPHIIGLAVAPNPQNGGGTSVGTVTIDVTAPASGMIVRLASSNPGVASVPATVTVPAGKTTTTFGISCGFVVANSTSTITATIENTQRAAQLQVLSSLVDSFRVESVIPSGVRIVSGDIASLEDSDNVVLSWTPMSINMKFTAVDMIGTARAGVTNLAFTVEMKGDNLVTHKVEAFNYTRRSWETLGTIPASTTDSSRTFPIGTPSAFINPLNWQMRTRITAEPQKGAGAAWTSSIDRALWTSLP